MIVFEHNGERVIISGWRAWLFGAVVVLAMTAVFAVLAVFFLGVAATAGVLLLIAIPVAVVVGLVSLLLGRR